MLRCFVGIEASAAAPECQGDICENSSTNVAELVLNDCKRLSSITNIVLTPAYCKIVSTLLKIYFSFALFLEIMALIRDFCKLPLSAPGKDYPFIHFIYSQSLNQIITQAAAAIDNLVWVRS